MQKIHAPGWVSNLESLVCKVCQFFKLFSDWFHLIRILFQDPVSMIFCGFCELQLATEIQNFAKSGCGTFPWNCSLACTVKWFVFGLAKNDFCRVLCCRRWTSNAVYQNRWTHTERNRTKWIIALFCAVCHMLSRMSHDVPYVPCPVCHALGFTIVSPRVLFLLFLRRTRVSTLADIMASRILKPSTQKNNIFNFLGHTGHF